MRIIDVLAKVLKSHYQAKIDISKLILQKQNRNASSRLSQSIAVSNINVTLTTAELAISAEDYWKFIDKGVKGYRNIKAPNNSPFQFKSKAIPVNVLTGATGWIANKQLVSAGKDAKARNRAMGFVFSRSIPRDGIKATAFISDVFNKKQVIELNEELAIAQKDFMTKKIKDVNND